MMQQSYKVMVLICHISGDTLRYMKMFNLQTSKGKGKGHNYQKYELGIMCKKHFFFVQCRKRFHIKQ